VSEGSQAKISPPVFYATLIGRDAIPYGSFSNPNPLLLCVEAGFFHVKLKTPKSCEAKGRCTFTNLSGMYNKKKIQHGVGLEIIHLEARQIKRVGPVPKEKAAARTENRLSSLAGRDTPNPDRGPYGKGTFYLTGRVVA